MLRVSKMATEPSNTVIRLGGLEIPWVTALDRLREYTAEANRVSERPYAFPAYDRYGTDRDEPDRLTDGDLMAPGLLNAPVNVRAFYGLQNVRSRLEESLNHPVLEMPLARIHDTAELDFAVRGLYAVLDDPKERPWGVKATTLSKLLHRKRPQSVVLHDRWVKDRYVHDAGPVPRRVRGRSWAGYMVSITHAIQADIKSQAEQFARLKADLGEECCLSHVRILDILVWTCRGDSRRPS